MYCLQVLIGWWIVCVLYDWLEWLHWNPELRPSRCDGHFILAWTKVQWVSHFLEALVLRHRQSKTALIYLKHQLTALFFAFRYSSTVSANSIGSPISTVTLCWKKENISWRWFNLAGRFIPKDNHGAAKIPPASYKIKISRSWSGNTTQPAKFIYIASRTFACKLASATEPNVRANKSLENQDKLPYSLVWDGPHFNLIYKQMM